MHDPLKEFMSENHSAFDAQEPPAGLWAQIDEQLPPSNVRRLGWRLVLRYAAAAVLFIGFGAVAGNYFSNHNRELDAAAQKRIIEFQEADAYYSSKVNSKLKELKLVDKNAITEKDIAELEDSFKEWKEDLDPELTDEEVMGIMIDHYQRKIEILENTINRIKEPKPERTVDI